MTSWYCNQCKLVNGEYCGPWDDRGKYFPNIKRAHRNCSGFQIGEPKLRGRENWGRTEIEKEFTKCFLSNFDKWVDIVIANTRKLNSIRLVPQEFKK